MWPVRCNSIIWPIYLWFKTGHSSWMAIVVLAVVIFLFDNIREKRSVTLTKWSDIACFKNSCGIPLKIAGQKCSSNQRRLSHSMSISQVFYSFYNQEWSGSVYVFVCICKYLWQKRTCDTAACDIIHRNCVSLKSESMGKPQFLV